MDSVIRCGKILNQFNQENSHKSRFTIYDIIKSHGGEIKLKQRKARDRIYYSVTVIRPSNEKNYSHNISYSDYTMLGYTQDINGEARWHEDILHSLDTARQDTTRVLLIAELANYYKFIWPDSALFYGYKALALARQIKFPKGEVEALR